MAIRLAGMNSGMDTDAMVTELVKAYKTKGDNIKKEQTKLEWKTDIWKNLNKKVKSFYSKYAANMQYSSYYNKKKTTVSDSTKATVVTADNAVIGTQTLEVNGLARAAYLTGSKLASGTTADTKLSDLGFTGSTSITINQGAEGKVTDGDGNVVGNGVFSKTSESFEVNGDTKISDVVNYFSSLGYNASFDESNGRFFISSKQSGAENNFDISSNTGDAKDALEKLGLMGAGSAKLDGENAVIKLNGAEFESDSNTFNINGLTITAKEKTSGEISIATDTDYDAIYDSIKSFIKDYGELISEMDKLYNADRAKGYEPLTDEEKDALTDTEVEKWETKIKDSLLRGDGNLSTVSNIMKNAMLQTYEVGDKTLSLSSFGIHTLGYFDSEENQRGVYHIDGDSDDEKTSGNTDLLKAAIAEDPEAVSGFFQKLTKNLYDQMSKISASTSNRSYGSFYDDKKMTSDYDSYKTKISDWEEYVKGIEDRYYDQFTQMEKAMANLNSQQSYISSLFGA